MSRCVEDFIDQLVLKYGSLRTVSRIYGVSHQNLSNWRKGGAKQSELFAFLERARKDLKLSKSSAWDKVNNIKPPKGTK